MADTPSRKRECATTPYPAARTRQLVRIGGKSSVWEMLMRRGGCNPRASIV
jgi:hypothetical protein